MRKILSLIAVFAAALSLQAQTANVEELLRSDRRLAAGNEGHYRFGHDTVLNAFVPLLNLNGCGYVPETADEVKYWFQNFNCPMASNVQFVLYRSKKSSEILFKIVWNGTEATIPQLDPVEGPYYRWADFVAWAEKIYAEHPQVPAPQMTHWN